MNTLEFDRKIVSLHPILKNYSKNFSMSREESEDLLQDTIMKALINKNKFKNNSNLKAWMFTIMKNTFINSYRKKSRRNMKIDDNMDPYFYNLADTNVLRLPDKIMEYRELLETCKNLKRIYATPLKLYINGYRYFEISSIMGLPMGTVKTRIHHARILIQKKLRKQVNRSHRTISHTYK